MLINQNLHNMCEAIIVSGALSSPLAAPPPHAPTNGCRRGGPVGTSLSRCPTSKVATSRAARAQTHSLEGAYQGRNGRFLLEIGEKKSGSLCAVHCALCAGSPRAAQLSSSAGVRLPNSRDIAPHTHNPMTGSLADGFVRMCLKTVK